MQEFLSDTVVTVTFRYGNSQQPDIPDVGSVSYTVYGHSGLPITGLIDVPVTTNNTTFESQITIPASFNSIDLLKQFERRTIRINYEKNNVPYSVVVQYRLLPVVLYTATPEAVRSFIGINPNELPDRDVDMYAAYLMTVADAGQLELDEALTSGTINELYANEAITMQAVLALIPSLQARVAQSEKNGPMGFDRPKIVDFAALQAAALQRYANAIGIVLGVDASATDFTLIVRTEDADPYTG